MLDVQVENGIRSVVSSCSNGTLAVEKSIIVCADHQQVQVIT
jgi:hypothetical protein